MAPCSGVPPTRRRLVALLACALTTAAAPEQPAPIPVDAFFVDYHTRVLSPSGLVWPYLGGHGHAAADLSAWKFPAATPADLAPPDLVRALEATAEVALDWDHGGLDVLYLQRLFLEVQGVLHVYAPYPARIDPAACAPAVLPDDGVFPEPPWWPPGTSQDRRFLDGRAADDLLVTGGLLCREENRRATAAGRRAFEDLRMRLLALDAATAGLAGEVRALLDDDGRLDGTGDDLEDPPPAAVAFEWMEELDRILAQIDLRRRLAPWLARTAAAYRTEIEAPAWRRAALLDCSAVAGGGAVRFRDERFLAAWARADPGGLRVQPPPLGLDDPDLDRLVRENGARIALALAAAARRSAADDGVELFRAERIRRMRTEWRGRIDTVRRLAVVGDPLYLEGLLRRRVDEEVLASELGAPFAAALVAFRDGLRERVLAFDGPDADLEELLYAVARLGVGVALDDPLAPEIAAEIFPWAPPERLEELRLAWPALVAPLRAEPGRALLEQGLGEFPTVRDLPPAPMAEFEMGALREVWRCVEPLLGEEEAARLRGALRHARRNLQDARQARFAAELAAACEAAPDVPALAARARFLLARLIPGAPAGSLDALVAALGLAAPCADRAAALLRFAALHDVMTAVFALESHAAGGSFDAPFDRAAALRVGGKPLAELDAWLRDYGRRQAARDRAFGRTVPPDSIDRLPDWMLAQPLREPPPGDEEYQRARAAWGEAYRALVGGRGYPPAIADSGWFPLNDYVEEEERHRRILVTIHGEAGVEGFTVRAVYSPALRHGELLDGEGAPAPGAEAITWSRRNGEADRYEIRIVAADGGMQGFEFPVPHHPGLPGAAAVREAQRFAETHVRRD